MAGSFNVRTSRQHKPTNQPTPPHHNTPKRPRSTWSRSREKKESTGERIYVGRGRQPPWAFREKKRFLIRLEETPKNPRVRLRLGEEDYLQRRRLLREEGGKRKCSVQAIPGGRNQRVSQARRGQKGRSSAYTSPITACVVRRGKNRCPDYWNWRVSQQGDLGYSTGQERVGHFGEKKKGLQKQ